MQTRDQYQATEDGGRIIRDTITLHRNHPKSAFAYDPRTGKFVRSIPVADANQGKHRIPAFNIEDAPYRIREWQQKIDYHAGNPKRADDVERWQRQLDIHIIREQINATDDADVLIGLYDAWSKLLDETEAHTKHLQAKANDRSHPNPSKPGWVSNPTISKRILEGIAKERNYIRTKTAKLKGSTGMTTRQLTDEEREMVNKARERSRANDANSIDTQYKMGYAPALTSAQEQQAIDNHVAADQAKMQANPYRKRFKSSR